MYQEFDIYSENEKKCKKLLIIHIIGSIITS